MAGSAGRRGPGQVRAQGTMQENLAVFDFELSYDDMQTISQLETGTSSFFSHRDPAIVKWMSERRLSL